MRAPVDPIKEPRTRAEALKLSIRAAHWSHKTRFNDANRAMLEKIIERNGWVRRLPVRFPGEEWRHIGTVQEWSIYHAAHMTFRALAGKERWGGTLSLAPFGINPLPENA